MWNGKVKEAEKLLQKSGVDYTITRGRLSDVSTDRYGAPDNDDVTDCFFSLTKLEDATANEPAVYDATFSVVLSEWDNFADRGKVVDPNDGVGIGFDTVYWQAADPSADGVSYTDDRFSFDGWNGGLKMQYDDPGTPTDGTDQQFSTGVSTKLEAISRDVFDGEYNVRGTYVHTWSDNGGYDMSFSFSNLTLQPSTSGPGTWTMGTGGKA